MFPNPPNEIGFDLSFVDAIQIVCDNSQPVKVHIFPISQHNESFDYVRVVERIEPPSYDIAKVFLLDRMMMMMMMMKDDDVVGSELFHFPKKPSSKKDNNREDIHEEECEQSPYG